MTTFDSDLTITDELDLTKAGYEASLKFIELLVFNIQRFDREQIFTCLSIVETMLELKPELDGIIFDQLHLFLISNFTVEFDSVKQYSIELLVLLLQTNSENEPLLSCIAFYKNKNPTELLEIETPENAFDCVCSLLLEKEALLVFLEEQGIELMLLILKNKTMDRVRAIKVLSYGMESPIACSTFIEYSGLKCSFGLIL